MTPREIAEEVFDGNAELNVETRINAIATAIAQARADGAKEEREAYSALLLAVDCSPTDASGMEYAAQLLGANFYGNRGAK